MTAALLIGTSSISNLPDACWISRCWSGCLECRETGFKGRQGIYEVMPMTESLQRFSDEKSDLPKLRQEAYREGMRSLRLSGAQKVAAGITTVNEVLRVTPEQ